MEEREYNGVIYVRSGPGEPWVKRGPAASQGVVLPADPMNAPKQTRAEAEAAIAAAQAPFAGQVAAADAASKGATAEQTRMETERKARAEAIKELRSAFQTDNILQVIRRARKTAQEDGGLGWESLVSGVPNTTARRLKGDLDTIFSNLSFTRLQQMRDESPTGGAVGNASDRDISLLGSTVASLDQGVDLRTFLERLDQVERAFIGMQVAAAGIDPQSDEARKVFKRDFGYTGVFAGELPQAEQALADPNATQQAVEIPKQYQVEHLRYLRDNWGNIDPRDYAVFRTGLDEQFDLTPAPAQYAAAVPGFNAVAQQGVTPEQLGVVPAPPQDMSLFEQGLNRAAQSAPGAFMANAGNAVGAGLPARLMGEQVPLELLREARPVSSFLGEAAGGIAGAAATGGIAGRVGAGLLARPLGAELAYGTTYGATQDDNPLRGAAMGAGGAVAGSLVGRQIGRAFPGTFAGDAMQAAEEAVPTVPQLKEQAAGLYADVQARGNTAMPDQTGAMIDRARKILASQGRIGANGEPLLQDGATKQAFNLMESFAGQPMSPVQAQTVRETLGEGLTSNVPKERRIASMLLEDFDQWADPVMPGAAQAREVSSRYIRGQQLQDLAGLGVRRGNRLKGNDVADTTRTMFGQLDEKVAKGQAFFDEPTQEAISRVAQGDPITNAMRALGKYGFGSVLPTTGMVSAGASTAFANTDPLLMAIPATVGAVGTAARNLASRRTLDAAREAELTALGGEAYRQMREQAVEEAMIRAGRIGGGLFGSTAGRFNRQQTLLPR